MRTFAVCGWYWISSNTSVRLTTWPGVTAMFLPTSNSEVSTIVGMRGERAMSRTSWAEPLTRLAPPWSSVALSTAGLAAGKFVGASADTTLSVAKRTRCSSAQSRSASSIRPSSEEPHNR